ncbi:hypothetical protein AZI85_03770 [Bdellovibrio bacteriovorus]|uniref:Uncharacterized protein n=1 Tax=Bdellovibrio bacteriovorus TaxID=959 RepID=A0A150WKM8_BDEBC|nr:hypothetical protein [Bdellovibrio bacteriovorus]KYG64541.1 hypothetical protein AZI85_03770 [Bdellovibrio bacteriovorus]
MNKSQMLAFAFLVSMSATAVSQGDLGTAQKTWDHYKNCHAFKDDDTKLINCTEPAIESKLSRPEKLKLLEFLILGYDFSELRKCRKEDRVQPTRPLATSQYFCMDVKGSEKSMQGYVEFIKEKGSAKIRALKFSF